MVTAIIFGIVIWCLTMWIKKRRAETDILGNVSERLPKGFNDSKLTNDQKRQTYAEARKKFLEKQAKPKIDLTNEAFIRHQVYQKHGHVNVPPNEGAFALSELRMERTKARRKVRQEISERIEAFGKATKKETEVNANNINTQL